MKAGRADSVPHSPSSPYSPLGTTERPPAAAPLCAPPLPWWWVNPAAMPGQRRSRQYRTAIKRHSDSVYTGPHRYTAIQFTALALDWMVQHYWSITSMNILHIQYTHPCTPHPYHHRPSIQNHTIFTLGH